MFALVSVALAALAFARTVRPARPDRNARLTWDALAPGRPSLAWDVAPDGRVSERPTALVWALDSLDCEHDAAVTRRWGGRSAGEWPVA